MCDNPTAAFSHVIHGDLKADASCHVMRHGEQSAVDGHVMHGNQTAGPTSHMMYGGQSAVADSYKPSTEPVKNLNAIEKKILRKLFEENR